MAYDLSLVKLEVVQQVSMVPAACPQCDQSLSVPGHDLRTSVRCPRCRAVLALADIVSRGTPIVPAFTLSSAAGLTIEVLRERRPANEPAPPPSERRAVD